MLVNSHTVLLCTAWLKNEVLLKRHFQKIYRNEQQLFQSLANRLIFKDSIFCYSLIKEMEINLGGFAEGIGVL